MHCSLFEGISNILKTSPFWILVNSRVSISSLSTTTYVISHKYAGDIHIFRPRPTVTLPALLRTKYQNYRNISGMSTRKSATHYYDVLGLSPKATQNQIKSAYYEMSKMHHPDISECAKSCLLITEINEAYEVLGNLRKRRMYDKGVYNPQDIRNQDITDVEEEQDYTQSYKERNFKRGNRPPPPTGRSKIYNFDEFYRQHYNEMRERRYDEFQEFLRYKEMLKKQEDMYGNNIPFPFVLGAWIIVMTIVSVILRTSNYDSDTIQRPEKSISSNND